MCSSTLLPLVCTGILLVHFTVIYKRKTTLLFSKRTRKKEVSLQDVRLQKSALFFSLMLSLTTTAHETTLWVATRVPLTTSVQQTEEKKKGSV